MNQNGFGYLQTLSQPIQMNRRYTGIKIQHLSTGCPDGYYGKHCSKVCSCEGTKFCHPSYGCISKLVR